MDIDVTGNHHRNIKNTNEKMSKNNFFENDKE